VSAATPRALLANAAALLVDLDMTLVDSTGAVERAWTAFARRHDLDPQAVLRFAQGRPSRETVRHLLPAGDHATEAQLLEETEVSDTEGVVALPGAHELLSSGRRLAIVTSCSTRLAHARLRAAGLPVPEVLVSSDGLARGKPDPECFLIGARRLDVDPRACVVLEDAPAGITAGLRAGATVIALRTSHPDADLHDADAVVDDIAALIAA
jgi:sugar-phosphatase